MLFCDSGNYIAKYNMCLINKIGIEFAIFRLNDSFLGCLNIENIVCKLIEI